MIGPDCTPVIFGPHGVAHCLAVPWWDPTPARLGWWILAAVAAALVFTQVSEWIRDRWERGCGQPRLNRRWYGTGSVIRDRDAALNGRYRVLTWCDEYTPIPWLLVEELADFEGAEPLAFWAPVTSFASVTVRRFRPHFIRCVLAGRVVLIPWPVKHLPLPDPTAIWRGES